MLISEKIFQLSLKIFEARVSITWKMTDEKFQIL